MTARIIDGKGLAKSIIAGIRKKVDDRVGAGLRRPGLAVIIVGEDHASHIYVRNKRRSCEAAGILSRAYDLPAETTETELMSLIGELNEDLEIDGILVQLPLPPHLPEQRITDHISPLKDVDGFHPENMGRLALGQPGLRPCTPKGVMTLLNDAGIELRGRHAVIVGRSNIVGRPLVLEFLNRDATTSCCHSRTVDLGRFVSMADILVATLGKPGVIDSEWIKPGAVVIDVGIPFICAGRGWTIRRRDQDDGTGARTCGVAIGSTHPATRESPRTLSRRQGFSRRTMIPFFSPHFSPGGLASICVTRVVTRRPKGATT